MNRNLPVVAIIGRPNVGKSSLFNLLINERKSIIDRTEGVTRDINIGHVKFSTGGEFLLYDTAGYLEKGDRLNQLVQQKVRQAIKDSEIVLFMVDGRNYHPIDEQLSSFLLKQNKQVIVLANKLDNRAMESRALEFYNLGIKDVIPISVTQNRGIVTLLEMIEERLGKIDNFSSSENEVRVAIVGKPNVGKSMLVNSLLGYARSIVDEQPGTTRDSLDDLLTIQKRTVRLVDTAGLRRQSKINDNIEYYSNVRTVQAIEHCDVAVVLADANQPLSNQDKHIIEMVISKGRGCVLAFNKWDLIETKNSKENYRIMQEFRKLVSIELPAYSYIPIEFISAKKKYKLNRLMNSVFQVYENYTYRVPTAELNQWLKSEIKETDSDKPYTQLKIYYVTQAFTAPPRFVFFINSKKYLKKDYPRYLENKIREAFDFSGVPLKITIREKNSADKNHKGDKNGSQKKNKI